MFFPLRPSAPQYFIPEAFQAEDKDLEILLLPTRLIQTQVPRSQDSMRTSRKVVDYRLPFLASWARVFAFEAELVAAMTALSIFSSNSLQAELLKLPATREQLPE